IACHPRLAFLDLEDAKVAKFQTAVLDQCLDDGVQDPLDQVLGLGPQNAHILANRLGQVSLGHDFPHSCRLERSSLEFDRQSHDHRKSTMAWTSCLWRFTSA